MNEFTPKGAKSRRHILNVSIRLFAEKGFAGVSVDEIVDAAGVNKRMVYHYFGSKESLYQAALADEYGKLEALEIKTLHPEEPVEKVISDIVSAYFAFIQDNPDFVQLILQENLNQGLYLEKMDIPLSKSPILDLLIQAVNAGQKNGTVRQNIDPRFLLISLIGNCMIYCSNRFTLSRALEIDLSSPKVLSRAKNAVIEMLLNGIKT
jgi:TetR/AcrR family transcriptional regulator